MLMDLIMPIFPHHATLSRWIHLAILITSLFQVFGISTIYRCHKNKNRHSMSACVN